MFTELSKKFHRLLKLYPTERTTRNAPSIQLYTFCKFTYIMTVLSLASLHRTGLQTQEHCFYFKCTWLSLGVIKRIAIWIEACGILFWGQPCDFPRRTFSFGTPWIWHPPYTGLQSARSLLETRAAVVDGPLGYGDTAAEAHRRVQLIYQNCSAKMIYLFIGYAQMSLMGGYAQEVLLIFFFFFFEGCWLGWMAWGWG